jgi:hypothetical protein
MSEQPHAQGVEGQVSGPGFDEAASGERNVRLRIDESKIQKAYANAFRTQATAEELSIDFGVNSLRPVPDQPDTIEVAFEADHRLIVNFYMAKRLALALGRIVRAYEERFGELEIDPRKRTRGGAGAPPATPPGDGA